MRERFHAVPFSSMVKTTMFNGVKHPDVALRYGRTLDVVRRLGYADSWGRLP